MAPISTAASSSTKLIVRTLTDGGQQPLEIAHAIADWLGEARESLEVAQYDFNLVGETAEVVASAIKEASARGVAVRVIYNVDHRYPIAVPPPPEPDVQLIASLGVRSKAVGGVPDLMHHKFVIRDRQAVWTGSTNWTDDSWARQENVILLVESPELAESFVEDFDQLWDRDLVEETGFVAPRRLHVDGLLVRPWFTPGFGEDLSARIARVIGRAKRRVRICSPVITAAPVLATLAQAVSEGKVDVAGCLDASQIQGVVHEWHANGNVTWKLPLLERVLSGDFTGKPSTPYGTGPVHDFMHAKVVVADDAVFTGSFNLSRSGEKNAENVLEIHDPELAEHLSAFVDEVRHRYPPVQLPA